MHPSVSNFLDKVWNSPTTRTNMSLQGLKDAIYDIYTPLPPPDVDESWSQTSYHPAATNQMAWRVYMSVKGGSLKRVWSFLQGRFKAQPGVVAAKHTTPAAAAHRVDTIVVYLRSSAAKDALIDSMRPLFLPKPGTGGAPVIPPKLRPADFKIDVPPTTQKVPGMQGVAHAQQPIEDGWAAQEEPVPHLVSFGMQLSSIVANAYKGVKSKPAFIEAVKANYLKEGMNINQPWQQLLDQSTRDQLVTAGNTSRRRRGKVPL